MATHSRVLAWRIPWTEEPGGLQSTVQGVAKSQTRLSTTEQPRDTKLPVGAQWMEEASVLASSPGHLPHTVRPE